MVACLCRLNWCSFQLLILFLCITLVWLSDDYHQQCSQSKCPPNPLAVGCAEWLLIGSIDLSLTHWSTTTSANDASTKGAISPKGGWSTARAASVGHWLFSPGDINPAVCALCGWIIVFNRWFADYLIAAGLCSYILVDLILAFCWFNESVDLGFVI